MDAISPEPPTLCVLVQRRDGTRLWWPKAEYEQNPESGSFIVTEQRRRTPQDESPRPA